MNNWILFQRQNKPLQIFVVLTAIAVVLLYRIDLPAQTFLSSQLQQTNSGIDNEPPSELDAISFHDESSSEAYDTGQIDQYGEPGPVTVDSTVLEWVSELIRAGEINQALDILANSSEVMTDQTSYFEGFSLNEHRLYLLIKTHYLLGHKSKVEELADTYLDRYINGKHFYWVYYYLSSVLFAQEKPLKQVYLVTEDFFSSLPKQEQNNLRRFLIENALRNREFLSAVFFLEDESGGLIDGYEVWIGDIIKNINEIDDIEQILERHENEEIYYELQLRKVQLMIRNGYIKEAEEHYQRLIQESGNEMAQYEKLPAIYRAIQLAQDTEPHKIGVILPITHRWFDLYARQALDGLELLIHKIRIDGKPIQLILKDSAQKDSSPEIKTLNPQMQLLEKQKLVKSQVRDLVENHGVIAILGPLAKSASLAAGEAAQDYKVPVISFSLTENIGRELSCLFRYQNSQLEEAKVMAEYSTDYLNAERFVLFYDTSSKSFEIMETFADTVRKKGGSIVGISKISSKQQDFSDSFKSFTGGLRELSEEELEELKETRERLESIVDFDAVFLPVETRTLKVIMDFGKLFDVENVWFLSGSEINVRENQLLTNTSRLRFIGTYPVSGVKTYLQPFFESHWKYYNFRANYFPPTSYTIYAYEALEVLGQLLQNPGNHNREALRNAIQRLNSQKVLTGTVSTGNHGELEKRMKILKIVGSDTVEVFN